MIDVGIIVCLGRERLMLQYWALKKLIGYRNWIHQDGSHMNGAIWWKFVKLHTKYLSICIAYVYCIWSIVVIIQNKSKETLNNLESKWSRAKSVIWRMIWRNYEKCSLVSVTVFHINLPTFCILPSFIDSQPTGFLNLCVFSCATYAFFFS